MLDLLSISHLMVTASYVFIPLQFSKCLSQSPHRHNMPWRLIFCLILVALFFMLCGLAHLLLALGCGSTTMFVWIQCGNAIISTTTAFYLIPLIPDMFLLLDNALAKMRMETKDSKSKLFTFMAFLCHEIRNPLFAITSSAECLQDTTLSQDQMEEVSSICDSSLLMLRLVNDVLDLSKLDSGKLQLECRVFDLHSLLRRLGDNMSRSVNRKHQGNVQLRCIIGPTVPQYIVGDSVRILQIVYNLLSNSCKFTSQGSITLEVQTFDDSKEEESSSSSSRMLLTDEDNDKEVDDTTNTTASTTNTATTTTKRNATGYTVTMSQNRPISMFASGDDDQGADSNSDAKKTKKAKKRRFFSINNNQDDDEDHGDDEEEEQVFSMALLGDDHNNPNNSNNRKKCNHPHERDVEEQGDCYKGEEHRVVLSITVADTGIGIPPERLEDIFEPYTQAKLSDFRQHGGTGLGLSIISSLTKTMGGTISVTSAPGEGAQFHLRLPVKLPNASEIEHDPTSSHRYSSSTAAPHHHLSSTHTTNMDYVGELLPNDQKQVPQQFKKCQRMPVFDSSRDLNIGSAEAHSDANNHPMNGSSCSGQGNSCSTLEHDNDNNNNNNNRGVNKEASMIQPEGQAQSTLPPLFPTSSTSTTTKPQGAASNSPSLFPISASTMPSNSRSPPTPLMTNSSLYHNTSLDMSASGRTTMMTEVPSSSGGGSNNSFDLTPNDHVVLIVDDNSVNRKILSKMLKGFGVEHRTACNGQEAVDALVKSRNHPPNSHDTSLPLYGLVLLDISMPVMDGNEAIQVIRKARITVPVVALSANVLSHERDRTIGLGANEFHTKPILRKNLYTLCKRYLSLANGTTPSTAVVGSRRAAPKPMSGPPALNSQISPLSPRSPTTSTSSIAAKARSIGNASDCSTTATDATNNSDMGLSESTSLQDLPDLSRPIPPAYGALHQ